MDNEIKSMPMVPLRGMTILPEMVVHFDVSRQRSIAAVQEAMAEGQEIFLVTQRSIDTEDPDAEDVFEIGTVAQVRQIIRWCGVPVPTRQALYAAMREVCREIILLAHESMAAVRANLPPNTVIGFDGSWDHRRHGFKCLFAVICSQTGQVIEAAVVTKSRTYPSEILCENSSMMEAVALRTIVPRLQQLPQIVGYVHDNDGKARNIV